MDVVLLGGALSVSLSMAPITCLVKHHLPNEPVQRLSPLTISLSLSFCLFALSVLEATPSSWLVLLDNRVIVGSITDDEAHGPKDYEHNEYLTVSFAYFVILSIIAAYVLIISPAMAGVLVLDRILNNNLECSSDNLLCYCCCCGVFSSSWTTAEKQSLWLRGIIAVIAVIYKMIGVVLAGFSLFSRTCWWLFCQRGLLLTKRDSNSSGVTKLPMTITDTTLETTITTTSPRNSTTTSNDNPRSVSIGCLMNSVNELLLWRGGVLIVGSVIGIAVTLALLRWLAPFIIQPKSTGNILALALSWMCAIGIVLSGMINGFGSVSMPHSCLAGLYLEPIKVETIAKATVDLEKTKESLQARKQQLKEIKLKQVSPTTASTPGTNGTTTVSSRWGMFATPKRQVKRTFSGFGEDLKNAKRKILEELYFLEGLVEEMKEDIEDMKYTQQMEAESRTTIGRIKSWLGVVFSVVLLARLYYASVSIWHHWYSSSDDNMDPDGMDAPHKRDPVTTALLWLVGHHMVTETEYDELSQSISLLLTAILSFSQVRTFLRTLAAMHRHLNHLFFSSRNSSSARLTPRSDSYSGPASSSGAAAESESYQTRRGVYMHWLAALMGSYFLTCTVLTKAMLPWQYRSSFSGALGGFDAFVIQSDAINAMFALSAVASAIVLALLFGIQKANAVRHNVSWMDDLGGNNSGRDLDV